MSYINRAGVEEDKDQTRTPQTAGNGELKVTVGDEGGALFVLEAIYGDNPSNQKMAEIIERSIQTKLTQFAEEVDKTVIGKDEKPAQNMHNYDHQIINEHLKYQRQALNQLLEKKGLWWAL